ncbi:FAD-dependent monooxygenase [Streptomyces violaceusniger]|uniref:FAD-dependent monooxygenase n=1 Tax=Streptomyces violaceusniger TaxID=68280 RepID=UPI0001E4C6B7
MRQVAGTDFGMRAPRWLSRFGNASRQAARCRDGRVLLAGDAAHMHMPMGGQGLSVGLQDAFNLGWKLAAVCQGRAPDGLLDTYHAERHPVGAALLENTRAQTVLGATHTADVRALRSVFGRLLAAHPAVNRQFAGALSALDVAYRPAVGERAGAAEPGGAGGGHSLAGSRAPDLGLDGAPEPSLYPLLADGRFVLLHLGPGGDAGRGTADGPGAADARAAEAITGSPDRMRTVTVRRPPSMTAGRAGARCWCARTAMSPGMPRCPARETSSVGLVRTSSPRTVPRGHRARKGVPATARCPVHENRRADRSDAG